MVAGSFIRGLVGQPGRARAAVGDGPKRLVIFFTPNGTTHKYWRPDGGGSDFSFKPGSILEPLAAHKDLLLILDGIDFHDVAKARLVPQL